VSKVVKFRFFMRN